MRLRLEHWAILLVGVLGIILGLMLLTGCMLTDRYTTTELDTDPATGVTISNNPLTWTTE